MNPADPDGILPEVINERFGDLAALEDEAYRRALPIPRPRRHPRGDRLTPTDIHGPGGETCPRCCV